MEGFITTLAQYGYVGIAFLMALESSLFPVPSELVMIPAGILAKRGEFNIELLVLAGGIGSVIGASVNYAIGRFIGEPFIHRFGKYFLITEKKYRMAHNFFLINANRATFIGRFIPVIRHLISLPAGIFRMNILAFVALTFIGASLWSFILVMAGYWYGQQALDTLTYYLHQTSFIVLVCLIGIGWYFLKKK